MATATRSKKTTKKPEARTARLMHLGNSTVLGLTSGKETTFYTLARIESQIGGIAFTLTKADRGDGKHEQYDVLLAGRETSCTCPGHTFCGHCKHVSAILALQNAGKLPQTQTKLAASTVPVPEPEEEETIILTEPPQPADERDNFCPTCGCHYREHVAGFCPR